jgi:lipopolysaccharide export system ATP-binding protein
VFKGLKLCKSFEGRKVVKDVVLEVNQGEVVGLLGPNGAGKTTTFYMMVGLIKADEGSIELFGTDITSKPLHSRALEGIGYLPQEPSVFRDLTVQENIYSVLECRELRRNKKRQMLVTLLNELGLSKIKKSKGRELSGGERRRVEIARTLALEPKYILLDEPFAGVDPIAVQDLQKIIIDLKKKNIGVLITDHNVRETLGIVDRAYIMNDGELLISGLPEEIISNEKAKKFYLGDQFKM